jgi:hypothetical protein
MRRIILPGILIFGVCCGKEERRPLPQGIAPVAEVEKPRDPGSRFVPPANASFRYYQRFSKNGDWDKGKAIPSETGLAIVRLLERSELWSARDHPELVAAWGAHPYLPGYAAALDVSAQGKRTHYVIRSGCGLFDVERDLWVLAPENKEPLIGLLKALSDKGREKFCR